MLKQDACEDAHGCPSTPCIQHSHWSPNTGPFVEWINELNKLRLRVSLDATCFYPDRQTLAAQCQDLIPTEAFPQFWYPRSPSPPPLDYCWVLLLEPGRSPLLEGTEMKEKSAGAEQRMQFIGRSQRFPTPFRVALIPQQGSEQDGGLLQRISHLMVSTALIYWNSSRKRQDVCLPDIWTFAVFFICPFIWKKARPPRPKASHWWWGGAGNSTLSEEGRMGKEEGGPDAFSSPSHTCRFFSVGRFWEMSRSRTTRVVVILRES